MFPAIQNAYIAGEVSPELFGRTDLAKFHLGLSTCRNFFINYRGGTLSRSGLKYVGTCKQAATASDTTPPRNIPFQFNINQGYILEFGNMYMRIISDGAYVVEQDNAITAISKASPGVFTYTNTHYSLSNGDWIFVSDVGGMTNFNGLVWIVAGLSGSNFHVTDLFGNAIDTTTFNTYTSGGTLERIYTVVSPYAVADLPYLKYTQSADTMSLTCVNQATGTDYAPYDLVRNSATSWAFTAVTFASSIAAPTGVSATPQASTTVDTYYSYVVTAINEAKEESVASSIVTAHNNDIALFQGSNVIAWSAVTDAVNYNVYKATPVYNVTTPSGVSFGLIGTSSGLNFVDTNLIADFTITPPQATNPFPSTGDYPSVVAYYQQRRVYANTKNNPDSYYMSRPGAYLNMDVSFPVIDSDAITGTPWAQQINGIQFLVPMTNGLVTLTGTGAWLVNGGSNSAITSSDQTATAQAYNGCNFHVQPLVANYNILYVQAKGSIVRDLSYNFFSNIFTGEDRTILSSHLFNYYQIQQWCWAEEPFKVAWAVRNDGIMLSLTYVKEQDVYAWARHDTNGLFVNVCSVTEPPVDAVYTIVKRYITGQNKWVYYQERMDNRNWENVEDSFCVDAGLQYSGITPNATLTPAAANGTANISAVNIISGGGGYVSPTAIADDPTGEGSGATFSVTVSGGIITAITPLTQGQNYQAGTTINITDSVGTGAIAQPIITNVINFVASSGVFSAGNVGDVIRIGNANATTPTDFSISPNGGGKAIITEYVSSTVVKANVTEPITNILYDNSDSMPAPVAPNLWTLSTPITSVSGLNHLEGMEVAILADGSVVPNQTVTDGSITLDFPASLITVGLPYTCQMQTLYLDPQGQPTTTQGKRKNIQAVVVRMQASRGMKVGTNQPDQSTQPNNASPAWSGLQEVKQRNASIAAGSAIPLYTGDYKIQVPGDWARTGQVAIEQSYPLPCNILATIPDWSMGDTNG